MEYPKFIITDTGFFRLGLVNMHKDLLLKNEKCYGGGYYEFDYVANRLILSGESYDFGHPRWSWIDTLKVPVAYEGMQIIYRPSNTYEDDFCVTDELEIEYVP